MTARQMGMITLLIVLSTAIATAEDTRSVQVGAKVWTADISYKDNTGSHKGKTLMYGLTASVDLPDRLWLSVEVLNGREKYDYLINSWGKGENSYTDILDGEIIFGKSLSITDVGIGFRYWRDSYKGGGGENEYGPLVYAGIGDRFGDTPVGWYGSATWNFTGSNDTGGNGSSAHFILEGGMSLSAQQLAATLGYRFKDYYSSAYDYKYGGPSAIVSYRF
jgi:hypothetical protein